MHVCVKSRIRRHGKGARSRPPCCRRACRRKPPSVCLRVTRLTRAARLPRLRGLAGAEGVLVRAHRRWQPRGPGPSRLGCARRPALFPASFPRGRGILRRGERSPRWKRSVRLCAVTRSWSRRLSLYHQPPSCEDAHPLHPPPTTHASARPTQPRAPTSSRSRTSWRSWRRWSWRSRSWT